jgi:hypothetical protein
MERVAGIEPACAAWKAAVLPLNYTRVLAILSQPAIQTRGEGTKSLTWRPLLSACLRSRPTMDIKRALSSCLAPSI